MKVLILGLNKSGTTALAYKLQEALGQGTALHFEPGRVGGAEDEKIHRDIVAKPGAAVTKNLIFPSTETNWGSVFSNADLYDRAIWIVRDPRDIIISNFFYHWFQGHKAAPEKFQLALQRTSDKEQEPARYAFIDLVCGTMTEGRAQLEAWQRSWYDILDKAAPGIVKHTRVYKYEDFVAQNFAPIKDYLGLAIQGETEVPDEHQRVVRTRSFDNWRRWFTDEDVDFFRPILSEFLATMGYDPDDWRLEYPQSLPSAEGSDYMTKLYEKKVPGSGSKLMRRIRAKLGLK